MERLTCSDSAADVGGILSIDRPLRVNNNFLVSFTLLNILVLSYIKTTKRSNDGMIVVRVVEDGRHVISSNAVVTPSKLSHVSHAVFLPFPAKDDV